METEHLLLSDCHLHGRSYETEERPGTVLSLHQQGLHRGRALVHVQVQGPQQHKPGAGVEAGGHHTHLCEAGASLPGSCTKCVAGCVQKCVQKAFAVLSSLLDMSEPLLGQGGTGVGEIAGGDVDLH